jgi:protein ImuB
VDRWGCVDVPALPLQLLLRREPEWTRHPVAVVDEDRPQGTILWVNERAHRLRIWPGRRYAEGLSLAADLRAGTVSEAEILAAGAELLQRLRAFTPEIEPSPDEPGVFWLNASGIGELYPSLESWARGIAQSLREARLTASVVVGFGRFGTYALARAQCAVRVLATARAERELADRVPLSRLHLDPKLRDALHSLGIEDVGAFRRLPPGGILERFGAHAHRLHRLALDERSPPLAPAPERVPARERCELEPTHRIDASGLLFLCKQRLARLVQLLRPQGEAVAALRLRLLFEKQGAREERISPAAPTLDEVQLTDLLRLRLESVRLDDELTGFELHAEAIAHSPVQKQLFQQQPKRDLAAGNRALARLRAELGEDAVIAAHVHPGHLPEGQFVWRPLQELAPAAPNASAELRLVRRILQQPRVLPARDRDDGRTVHVLGNAVIDRWCGPYVVSGGWWQRAQHREYWFAETKSGEVLWVFYDRARRTWVLHGVVE